MQDDNHKQSLNNNTRGATLIEYTLLLVLIAMALIAVVKTLSTNTGKIYQDPKLLSALKQ